MPRPPAIGEFAPAFTLPSTHGPITLSEQVSVNGIVLLVFYPRDGTLVCTRQLCNYRDNLSMFTSLGVDIIAINDDSLESHEAFSEKYRFPFPLAIFRRKADELRKVISELKLSQLQATAEPGPQAIGSVRGAR